MAGTDFEFWAGDDIGLSFMIRDEVGAPIDLTGAEIELRWKVGQTVAEKTIGAGITITDAAGGVMETGFSDIETQAMAEGSWRWDLRVTIGEATTLVAFGLMTVKRWVA